MSSMGYNRTTKKMKKEEQKELQGRRDFFKKVAKSTLPVLGAVLLASTPNILNAAEAFGSQTSCTSCSGTCTVTCGGACVKWCTGTCTVTCGGNCIKWCTGSK